MLGERLFEEGLVGKEGDLECKLKLSMKALVCGEKKSHQYMVDESPPQVIGCSPIRSVRVYRERTSFWLGAPLWR